MTQNKKDLGRWYGLKRGRLFDIPIRFDCGLSEKPYYYITTNS